MGYPFQESNVWGRVRSLSRTFLGHLDTGTPLHPLRGRSTRTTKPPISSRPPPVLRGDEGSTSEGKGVVITLLLTLEDLTNLLHNDVSGIEIAYGGRFTYHNGNGTDPTPPDRGRIGSGSGFLDTRHQPSRPVEGEKKRKEKKKIHRTS